VGGFGFVLSALALGLGTLLAGITTWVGSQCTWECGGYAFTLVFIVLGMVVAAVVGFVSWLLYLVGGSAIRRAASESRSAGRA
jgi:hypothetical protein